MEPIGQEVSSSCCSKSVEAVVENSRGGEYDVDYKSNSMFC